MTIRNLDEANQALLPYVPLVARLTGRDMTLERIVPLMELLGNPQERLRVVHIAGTSGKTSTAYYMAALLRAAGKQVGLTVSPHIDSVTERVQINGLPLTEPRFCALLGEFLEILTKAAQPPTYFELLYAFAIWVFDREAVEYAVVETGMGGLHDATNVISRADKVCVITDIGLDHTPILGNTLAEIAAQKIGIAQPGNQVFMYQQDAEIMRAVRTWTASRPATVHIVQPISPEQGPATVPDFQRRNWQLARAVYAYLAQRDNLTDVTEAALRQTQTITVPGRMEIRPAGDKTIIMDGAHNAQKIASFVESFQKLYPAVRPAILIGLKHDKSYAEAVRLLAPLASRVITTAFQTTQDLPVRSADPEALARAFAAAGVPTSSLADLREAYEDLLADPEPIGVIIGSFYLLSQLRAGLM